MSQAPLHPSSWTTPPAPTCPMARAPEAAFCAAWVWGPTGVSGPQTASLTHRAPLEKQPAPAHRCYSHLALEEWLSVPWGPWEKALGQTGRVGRSWDSGSWRRLELGPPRWRRPWGGGLTVPQTGEKSGVRSAGIQCTFNLHRYTFHLRRICWLSWLYCLEYSLFWLCFYVVKVSNCLIGLIHSKVFNKGTVRMLPVLVCWWSLARDVIIGIIVLTILKWFLIHGNCVLLQRFVRSVTVLETRFAS